MIKGSKGSLKLALRITLAMCFGSTQAHAREDVPIDPASELVDASDYEINSVKAFSAPLNEGKNLQKSRRPKDRKEKNPLNTVYDFVVGTSSRGVIHQRMFELYEESKTDIRQEWGFLYPDYRVGAETSDRSLPKSMQNEVGTAATKQFIDSVPELKNFTEKMKFSMDFSALFTSKSLSAKNPREVKYGILNKNDSAAPVIGPIVAKEDPPNGSSEASTDKATNYSDLGKFTGGLAPRLGDRDLDGGAASSGKSFMDFVFQQQDGFYVYRLPVGKGPVTDAATHEFMAPLWGTMRVSNEIDSHGQPVSSALRNLLIEDHRPRLDFIYVHENQSCAAEFQLNHHASQFKVKGQVPTDGFSLEQKTFVGEGAEYTMGYSQPL
jgi:hypothetical protein